MKRLLFFVVLLYANFIPFVVNGQQIKLLHTGSGVSIRGLSAVSDQVVWVSGNKGTVGRSLDGGVSWQWSQVAGHQDRDFRDIEAFDKNTAIIMAVGEPAILMKTINGGSTWKIVYYNNRPGMFLDAMEFWNDQSGIVVGDPVEGRFFIARTFDGGFNWRAIIREKLPGADSGEACFAASGTNVRALDRDEACFVTGGKRSRLFWKREPIDLPMIQGKETQGANSVAIWYRNQRKASIIIVGGDFANDTSRYRNCAVSRDGGASWITPANPPHGYRSCVEYLTKEKLITCGLTGVDISLDEGINWNHISDMGFHVCRKSKKGKSVFLAGANGNIGMLIE